MRFDLRPLFYWALGAGLFGLFAADLPAAKIDAVRGRKYQITKRHGPWMILVATFHAPPEDRRGKGMTPEEAADELVYELRTKGIPAYAFRRSDEKKSLRTTDRIGRHWKSSTTVYGGVAVLAGNYPSVKDKVAQATLQYVKTFRPKFLTDIESKSKAGDNSTLLRLHNGGIYRSTPGRPYPFSGAHLAPNPLLSLNELYARRRDPLLLKLNSGNEYSLMNNRGKYTLQVKAFYGKTVTAVDDRTFERKASAFKVSDSLDRAGRNAWELAVALRKYRKMQAWVWHDHHKSIVTVGSFQSPNDPRIAELIKSFKAKYQVDPRTGRRLLLAEGLTIPPYPKRGEPLQRRWVFDPQPKLILVPLLGK